MSSTNDPSELQAVVRRAQAGSLDDFQQLYSLFGEGIYAFIWRLVGSADEAEDLTQETFLKAFADLRNLRDAGQFKFWLYRIARNEVYQRIRKSKRRPEVSIDNEEIPYYEFIPDENSFPDPERRMLSRELNEVVRQCLQSLKPKYRDVFVLAVFEKMSYEDITKIVGRSLLSVKTDIYRARLAMKEALTDYLVRSRRKGVRR
ncbi:MAG TPA: sigma-70 family RNA polymerase sigma factor [Acidobacteriota bacterium]|nr:sigma-70 family RNA polymerase sigma factor [Acidobacteriota bacterium]HRV09429.1 sigma-70 family RNA polymerase sigma factor [Acidobacteriota bacterium]